MIKKIALKIRIKFNNAINFLLKKRIRGLIQVDIDNADLYFSNNHKIKIYKSIEQEQFEIKKPRFLKQDFFSNFMPFQVNVKSVVLEITDHQYSFQNNHLIDHKLNVLYQPNIKLKSLPIYHQDLAKYKKINGTIAYLSNTLPNHYGHWFQYTLHLLRLYWQFIDKQEIDYYYIGDCQTKNFQLETMIALGIKPEQIVNFACKGDRLITGIIDRGIQNEHNNIYPDIFAYRFSRDLFLPKKSTSNSKYPKRVYIKRGNVKRRQVINEYEVLSYLQNIGFEPLIMDNITVKEQAHIFAHAEVIIAPHGSALANLAYIQENTKVIEIFPFNYPDISFFAYATYAKANYFYMRGDELESYQKPSNQLNIQINMDKLQQICKLAEIL